MTFDPVKLGMVSGEHLYIIYVLLQFILIVFPTYDL